MSKKRLIDQIRAARLRLVTIGAVGALLIACVVGIAVIGFGVWCDLVWDLPVVGRVATLVIAVIAAAGFFLALTIRTFLLASEKRLARSLDRAVDSDGETLTGVSLLRQKQDEKQSASQAALTDGLAELAISTAAKVAQRAKLAEAVPVRPAVRSGVIMLMVSLIIGGLFLAFPNAAATQWQRFISFSDDMPPYSRLRFDVEPKGVSVRYGEEFDVSTSVSGGLVDQVELVLENEDGTQETLPMFSTEENRWRTTVARVTQEADYFVRTRRTRSKRYHLDVVLVPRIEEVRVRVEWPEYANRASYEGPVPKGGIAGLPGTRVTLHARSNRPLGEKSRLMVNTLDGQQIHPMQPSVERPNEVTGQFDITDDGSFEIRLVDSSGHESSDTYRGAVTMLSDTRPFVRLLQPQQFSFATPTITIAVDISATDDFGISRLLLYRSLNDSRPLPYLLPLDKTTRSHLRQMVYLPLKEYGLKPGDTIRLFARVEDNHPAGAQGSESRVAEISIISQEEFEEYLRAEKGVELLTEKYSQISRRMEKLLDELKKIQEELDALNKDGNDSKDGEKKSLTEEQIRQRLQQIRRLLAKEIEKLQMMADYPLPYDMEETLNESLQKQIDKMSDLHKQTGKLLKKTPPTEKDLKEHLKKVLDALGQSRKLMDQATEPLEWIEATMPLMIAQERFKLLVAKQKDLAKRMKTFDGKNNPDDPKMKVRMQELEEEQKQVGEQLASLLSDIQLHAANLPQLEELEKLRWTAIEFAEALYASGAAEAITAASDALAEFQGTKAVEQSQRAADILEQFISKCENMGGQMWNCPPSFNPCLSQMKSTMQQLLQSMKSGGGGGYGMFAPGSQAAGLYGQMQGMMQKRGTGQGQGNQRGKNHAYQESDNPDHGTWSDQPSDASTSGSSEATVPVRYQRRVGNYFQRILEEFHEKR